MVPTCVKSLLMTPATQVGMSLHLLIQFCLYLPEKTVDKCARTWNPETAWRTTLAAWILATVAIWEVAQPAGSCSLSSLSVSFYLSNTYVLLKTTSGSNVFMTSHLRINSSNSSELSRKVTGCQSDTPWEHSLITLSFKYIHIYLFLSQFSYTYAGSILQSPCLYCLLNICPQVITIV